MSSEGKTIYWKNGQLKREVFFEKGVRSGSDRMWNDAGVLVDEGFYQKGLPVGVHRRWNQKGSLIEEVTYQTPDTFTVRSWNDAGVLIERNEEISSLAHWVEKKGYKEQEKGDRAQAVSLFMKRFPKLTFLTWGAQEEGAVFEEVAPFSLGKAEAVFVYGLGNGGPYFQLVDWLHEDPKRKLIFLEEDGGKISRFLSYADSLPIIRDLQVEICHVPTENDLETVAAQFPFHRLEMVAVVSKNKKSFRLKRIAFLRKATLAHALYIDRLHGEQPLRNILQNRVHLAHSFYANRLKESFCNIPAIVCGAGPSLNEAIPLLKKYAGKALIIAGGSTLAALSSAGVPIHFGMVIDPNLEEYRRMKNSFAFETPMIYSTRVHPSIFQTTGGPFGYMRSGIGGILEVWWEEALGLEEPLIGQELSSEAMSVTTICTAFAHYLGCNPILLSGVDLAYTDDKRYAEGVLFEQDPSFSFFDEEKSSSDRIVKRKNGLGVPVNTAIRWVIEGAVLANFARKHRKTLWINTSLKGLKIAHMKTMSLEEAGRYLSKSFDIKRRVDEAIEKVSMPAHTQERVEEKTRELFESLERMEKQLAVLIGREKGSTALAEIELLDEIAYAVLFSDVEELCQKRGISSTKEKWEFLLTLIQKSRSVQFPTFCSSTF